MAEENQFFRPVRDFCQRKVMTCGADDALVEAVMTMRERNISSMVVLRDGIPDGIFTDRDLRTRLVAPGLSYDTPAAEIMSRGVVAVKDLLREQQFGVSRDELAGTLRVELEQARALAGRPEIIFGAEPTGNLDPRSTEEVLGILRSSVDDFGQTVVMVTHDNDIAARCICPPDSSFGRWSRRSDTPPRSSSSCSPATASAGGARWKRGGRSARCSSPTSTCWR